MELGITGDLFSEVGVSLVVVSHQNTDSLEFLEAVSDDLAGTGSVMLVGRAVVLLTTIDVSESADTDLRTEINLSGERS